MICRGGCADGSDGWMGLIKVKGAIVDEVEVGGLDGRFKKAERVLWF